MSPPEDNRPSPAAAAFEFRVLAGSQRGCRLPLPAGRTLAGATAGSDLLLDGCAADAEAFVLHVGEAGVELEPLDDALRLRGERVAGRVALAPGESFVLGMARYAVDLLDAPWPQEADAAPAAAAADDGTPDAFEAAVQAAAAAAPAAAAPKAAPALRRRLSAPFWLLWLSGTAVFGCAGVGLIVAALNPAKALPMPSAAFAARPNTALADIVAAANRAQAVLALKPDGDGRWRLQGSVPTHDQQVALIRAARAVDPGLRIDVQADDDMALLADDTIERLSMDDQVRIARMHAGELDLQGQPADDAMYAHLVDTLKLDVPGLRVVRLRPGVAVAGPAPAPGDTSMRAQLQRALADADLADAVSVREDGVRFVVSGALDEDAHARWTAIRERLFALGRPLEIVERFEAGGASGRPAGDVVLAVGGAVPYVMHGDGRKEGRAEVAQP
jgi:type III secretion system YscD/HrpQ family protein